MQGELWCCMVGGVGVASAKGNLHYTTIKSLHTNTTSLKGRQVTQVHTVGMCEENTPALQSEWCSTDAVTVGQRIPPLDADTPPRCASLLQQPSPDMFCRHCLCQTCVALTLE